MSRGQYRQRFDLWLAMKKLALSGFVVFTFLIYVIDQQLAGSKQAANPPGPAEGLVQANQSFTQPRTNQSLAPTQVPQAVVAQGGQYKDGTYDGSVTDAFYGSMQVEAVIRGGKLTQVQILQSPHDRRTSRYINSQALPWLQSEAIQAQSANVDFISGATLTSDAFVKSLGSALQSAQPGA